MFHKYPSTDQIKSVVKQIKKYTPIHEIKPVEITGTVKIHGTNGGVTVTKDGKVSAQSRNRELTLMSDNAGFCAFVDANKSNFSSLVENLQLEEDQLLKIYGEWCGGNIQSGVGVSGMTKAFVVFSAAIATGDELTFISLDRVADVVDEANNIYLISKFGEYKYELDIMSQESINGLEELTLNVEEKCPVAQQLNPNGNLIGEGLVWTGSIAGNFFKFKHKGSKHARGGGSKKVSVSSGYSPDQIEAVKYFLSIALSNDRLMQGLEYLNEMGLDDSPKNTGTFLKWVSQDIMKECKEELADLYLTHQLEWKNVVKEIMKGSKSFYQEIR